jgi:anti-sigma regulatory factor (Ser/Thr protein kinase)
MTGDAFLTGAAGDGGGASRVDAQVLMLDQAFGPDSLPTLRAALQAHARQAGLADERAGDLVLAVHELAANAIAHGAGHGQLRLWRVPGALCCEVTDGGPANQGRATGGSTEPGPSPVETAVFPVEAGHGLWLARQVATRLDLWSDERGTRAVITFQLPPQA